jgi:AcrR family transcriptional regulator
MTCCHGERCVLPTSTFLNLPEEKREKIIRAIKDEFSRAPFDKVSINKIVQAAGIPRGSFYQYFADKDDMLGFILLDYQRLMLEQVKASLRAGDGDIFAAFVGILDSMIRFVMEEANSFCRNLFADIKVDSSFYFKIPRDTSAKNVFEELKPLIDFNMLDVRDEHDFTNMLDILLTICRDATAEVFLNMSDCEKAMQKYRQKLELLKHGFMKNKEQTSYA